MKTRTRWRLALVAGFTIWLMLATYFIAYLFPVIELKYSKPTVFRPPSAEESIHRLVGCVSTEILLVVVGLLFLRWYNGKEVIPEGKLLPVDPDAPLKGELLMPLVALGFSPPTAPRQEPPLTIDCPGPLNESAVRESLDC